MKKKYSTESAPCHAVVPRLRDEGGFVNLRALIGLFLLVAGLFLALVSFGPATAGFAQGITREQMTLSLAQAAGVFQPPPCVPGQEMFTDVPASSPFCPWIEELVRRGITSGCTSTQYCPSASITRAQMAIFLLKATGWLAITDTANTAVGDSALISNTTGAANTATGYLALNRNTEGGANTASGVEALFSNTIGNNNTANGYQALFSNTTGGGSTATGYAALKSNTEGFSNTATGANALVNNTTGVLNTATGNGALSSNTTGFNNTANGYEALFNNTEGFLNTANGHQALVNNTGAGNTALGYLAGQNLTTGDDNICIASDGVAGEGGTIRIGRSFIGATYIAGIFGQTSSGGTGVVINSAGKLGTTTSSRRFKDDIRPMNKASEALFALKPVTFRYKKEIDPQGIPQFGLVAEDVEKVNPDLVVRDAEGQVNTVRYDQVNAMLLNEFLKEHRKVEEQNGKLEDQACKIREQEATIAELKNEMGAVVAQLKEQAAQIQKVSAQLEAGKPARQIVLNKP